MKITIIGAGNMGGSAAVGFASRGVLPGADITVTARHAASLERFRQFGIRTSTEGMVILKYELKRHRKYILGWAIALALCVFVMKTGFSSAEIKFHQ